MRHAVVRQFLKQLDGAYGILSDVAAIYRHPDLPADLLPPGYGEELESLRAGSLSLYAAIDTDIFGVPDEA